MLLKILTYICTVAVVCGNECAWPQEWRASRIPAWLTSVVQDTKVGKIISYNVDKTAATALTTNLYITVTYNCQAYASAADGTQYYLKVTNSRHDNTKGLCVARKKYGSLLIGREAGDQASIADCQTAVQGINLHSIYLPLDPHKSDGETLHATAWSVMTEVDCPMPGRHKFTCQLPDNKPCPPESWLIVSKSYMSVLAPNYNQYPDLPMVGSIKCVSVMSAEALGEPATNDPILIIKWSTNTQSHKVRFYCIRYYQHANRTISMSLDMDSSTHLQCQAGASHDWNGQHGGRNYFRMLLIPQFQGSTIQPPPTESPTTTTTTTTAPTTPPPPKPRHLQMVIQTPYSDITQNSQQTDIAKSDLRTSLQETCDIETRRITFVHLEEGAGDSTMVTYDVMPGTPSLESCKDILKDQVTRRHSIQHGGQSSSLLQGIFLWEGSSLCPEISCMSGSQCWIRQGEYSCECFTDENVRLSCPGKVAAADPISTNKIIIFAVVAVAGVLVIVAIIVIVIVVRRRRAEGKDDATSDRDSIGSMEQQERDMYSSIGKKPTAYHERSFIVDEDEGYGEKTGIHGSGYM